jgi:hypothetical protein
MSDKNNEITLESLQEQIKALQSENTGLTKIIENMLTQVSEPSEDEKKVSLPKDAVFKHNGIKYEIIIPHLTVPGIGYRTADDILQDEKAQAELVRINSGAIKKIA